MQDTRSKISATARTIFASEGVDGISMRRIAAEVGITPTAIYRHFADKGALIDAVVDEGFSLLEAKLLRASKGVSGKDALRVLGRCYIDFAVAHPRYFDCMFLAIRTGARRYPSDFEQRKAATFNIVMDVIAAAMADGELKEDDVLKTGMAVWSLVHGLAALYRGGRFGEHPGRFRKVYEESFARLLEGLAA